MKVSEVGTIADAMVKAAEKSGERIAKGMVKSAERSGERIARGIVESSENIAKSIVHNSTENAEALKEGFREIGRSLRGTRAELMMDVLLKQSEANGGKIPDPGSGEWNRSKEIAKQVLKEFSHEE